MMYGSFHEPVSININSNYRMLIAHANSKKNGKDKAFLLVAKNTK